LRFEEIVQQSALELDSLRFRKSRRDNRHDGRQVVLPPFDLETRSLAIDGLLDVEDAMGPGAPSEKVLRSLIDESPA
jgi:hypothetical protein